MLSGDLMGYKNTKKNQSEPCNRVDCRSPCSNNDAFCVFILNISSQIIGAVFTLFTFNKVQFSKGLQWQEVEFFHVELLSIERKKNKPCLVFKTGSDVLFEFCYLADERENLQRKTQTLHNPNTKKKKKKVFPFELLEIDVFQLTKKQCFL